MEGVRAYRDQRIEQPSSGAGTWEIGGTDLRRSEPRHETAFNHRRNRKFIPMKANACDASQLDAFLLGDMTGDEAEALTRHLD